jgi:hypothetical protein
LTEAARKKKHAKYMKGYRLRNLDKFKKMEKDRARQRRNDGYRDDPKKVKSRNDLRDKDGLRKGNRERREEILKELVEAYGGKCQCCGEDTLLFMTIDHIFNDGANHRRKLGIPGKSGIHIYRELKRLGYPKDRYRLLCFNCNCGRARNGGTCPHKERSQS